MQLSRLVRFIAVLTMLSFWLGRQRAVQLAKPLGGIDHLHSLPQYYGYIAAVWAGLPAVLGLLLWLAVDDSIIQAQVISALPASVLANYADHALLFNEIHNLALGALAQPSSAELVQAADHLQQLNAISRQGMTLWVVALVLIGSACSLYRLKPNTRARNQFETVILAFLIFSSLIAIFTTLGIVLSVLFESSRFFQTVPVMDFLFGLEWSPQTAIRADQVGASGAFGALPLFVGTLLISTIAMCIAVPIGLMSAIYLSEYASSTLRSIVKPLLEILAGIPTVVYGFFAALVIAPHIRHWVLSWDSGFFHLYAPSQMMGLPQCRARGARVRMAWVQPDQKRLKRSCCLQHCRALSAVYYSPYHALLVRP